MEKKKKKSTFTTSDAEIIFKLHEAAADKAQAKLGKNGAIVNTGVGKQKNADKTFQNKDALYEVAVSLMLEKWQNPEAKDMQTKEGDAEKKEATKVEEENKKELENGKKICEEALREYFQWFAGDDAAKKINDKSITAYNPDPTDFKKIVDNINNFVVPSFDEKKLEDIRAKKKDLKPIIGYKVGFQLIYEGKE